MNLVNLMRRKTYSLELYKWKSQLNVFKMSLKLFRWFYCHYLPPQPSLDCLLGSHIFPVTYGPSLGAASEQSLDFHPSRFSHATGFFMGLQQTETLISFSAPTCNALFLSSLRKCEIPLWESSHGMWLPLFRAT